MRKKEVFKVVFGAIMISLAIVLEYLCKVILVLKMPNGGGISIAMLPLVVISVVCGGWYGLSGGIIFGVIDCFVIDMYSFNLASFILDYILAFSSVAFISIFRKKILAGKKQYFVIGFIIVMLIRLISSGFSGVINAKVWGYDEVFLEGVFGEGRGSVLWLYLYSFIWYNLPYITVSGILSVLVGLLGYRAIFQDYNHLGKNEVE